MPNTHTDKSNSANPYTHSAQRRREVPNQCGRAAHQSRVSLAIIHMPPKRRREVPNQCGRAALQSRVRFAIRIGLQPLLTRVSMPNTHTDKSNSANPYTHSAQRRREVPNQCGRAALQSRVSLAIRIGLQPLLTPVSMPNTHTDKSNSANPYIHSAQRRREVPNQSRGSEPTSPISLPAGCRRNHWFGITCPHPQC